MVPAVTDNHNTVDVEALAALPMLSTGNHAVTANANPQP
jgi:hypothetical protein